MRFEVSGHGPLKGDVTLPGDRLLTLTAMAFAPLCHRSVRLVNQSVSSDVGLFRAFLENAGVSFEDTDDGFVMRGHGWKHNVEIGADVPDAVLHCVAAGTVFSGRDVTVLTPSPARRALAERIVAALKPVGLGDSGIIVGDDTVTLQGSALSTGDVMQVRSAWSLELYSAAAMAAEKPLRVSVPASAVSHSVRLLEMLGFPAVPDVSDGRDAELERRLAKMSGGSPPDFRRFSCSGGKETTIVLPGDTLVAGALALTAALVQKSGLNIKNVLWEQGRRGLFESLRRMKARLEYTQNRRKNSFDSADVMVKWSPLEGIHVTDMQALTMIPELMLMGAAGAFASGETVISDAADGCGVGRGPFVALAEGLEMLGAHIGDYADGIVVRGGRELRGDLVDACGHPAVALAFMVTGMNSAGTTTVFGFDENEYPVNVILGLVG